MRSGSNYHRNGKKRSASGRMNSPVRALLMVFLIALLCANAAVLYTHKNPDLFKAGNNGKDAEPVGVVMAENPHEGVSGSDSEAEQPPYVPVSYDCGEAVVFKDIPRTLECSASDVVWSGWDKMVVSVSDVGTVSGLAVGETELTATAANGDTYHWNLKSRKMACLSFDDFPNENTQSILDTLDAKGVKATFFLCKIPKDSEFYPLYKQIADKGHTLGNHTTTHNRDRLFSSSDNLTNGFRRMEEYLGEMGYSTKFIRLPYGSADPYNLDVRKSTCHKLRSLGYSIVDWSALTNDSYCSTLDDQWDSLNKTLDEDIEIILMHHKKSTANNLSAIIDRIREKGYEFDTIDNSPMLFSQLYKWEENINQKGAGKYTKDTLTGVEYTQP